jgi:hypothetical protein
MAKPSATAMNWPRISWMISTALPFKASIDGSNVEACKAQRHAEYGVAETDHPVGRQKVRLADGIDSGAHKVPFKGLETLQIWNARPERFELPTLRFEGSPIPNQPDAA